VVGKSDLICRFELRGLKRTNATIERTKNMMTTLIARKTLIVRTTLIKAPFWENDKNKKGRGLRLASLSYQTFF
jgi:hypothetical protein